MKKCNKCEETKELSEFSKKTEAGDGLQTLCKQCVKMYAYNNQKKYKYKRSRAGYMKEYMLKKENRAKARSRANLNWKIGNGEIRKRNICEICMETNTECHHDDYKKPYDFVELCKKCHSVLHYGRLPRESELQAL